MAGGGRGFIARGFTDGSDTLVSADEPLASLQLACGGELPGKLAVPALLELVRKARSYDLKLARAITAQDEDDKITAWAEVTPERASGGCAIGLANWQTVPRADNDGTEAGARREIIERQAAELTARLDKDQNVLAASANGPALASLARAMQAGAGRAWTQFVRVAGSDHAQPLHWRLLDGAEIAIDGDPRSWQATLIPVGKGQPGSEGFELLLGSLQAPPRIDPAAGAQTATSADRLEATVGREIAPVLRQPIARIIANAETIRTKLAGPLADEYSDYAADIAAAGQHLMALLDDLADLEVVENEKFTTAPDQIDLADVARRAVGILGVRARERGIVIEGPPEGETAPATAEFRRVLQILLNLVGNAIRYSPEGATIRLSLQSDARMARITVADEGPGISPEDQAKVFSKFERLGRSGDGGSGLGLYISRRLARAMDGDIAVESEAGKGARFTLSVPARA